MLLQLSAGFSDVYVFDKKGDSWTLNSTAAAWNYYLPNYGRPKLSVTVPLDRESYNLHPAFSGRLVLGGGPAASFGCEDLLTAPGGLDTAVFVRRGRCSFTAKMQYAFDAGYKAMILADSVPNIAPVDMTACPNRPELGSGLPCYGPASENYAAMVPGWAVAKDDGDMLEGLLTQGVVTLHVMDDPRREPLGRHHQENRGGPRLYASQ